MIAGKVRISNGNGNGFRVEDPSSGIDILLDPRNAKGLYAVSHAHTDHLPGKVLPGARGIFTPETKEFAEQRTGFSLDPSEIPDFLALRNAGHMLGSSMVEVDTSAGKILYTGDFNTRDRLILKGAKPSQCEILILDATFSGKKYDFPEIQEIISTASEFAKKSHNRAIFYGYSYGKAQLLTRLAHELGIPAIVQAEIYRANLLAKKFKHDIGEFSLLGSPESKELIENPKNEAIVIAPMHSAGTLLSRRLGSLGFRGAAFTGWERAGFSRGGFEETIPLSDHSDFEGLVSFVEKCAPKRVILAHSKDASELAQALTAQGFSTIVPKKGFSLDI